MKQEAVIDEGAVAIVAQALFDRLCERCAARGHVPHHPAGTLVSNMPPSYQDDYLDDARAAIRAYLHAEEKEKWAAAAEHARHVYKWLEKRRSKP